MLVADWLSRLPDKLEIPGLATVIHTLTRAACLSEKNYNCYRRILANDENYQQVVDFVEKGWLSFHKLVTFCPEFL